jgi:hypothetical protein
VEGGGREDIPAPGPPSTNITVTFSLSNMGLSAVAAASADATSPRLWAPGRCRASMIFSTTLGAIAVLIRRVNGPDERVVVWAGARGCGCGSCAVVNKKVVCGERREGDCDEESWIRCSPSTLWCPHTLLQPTNKAHNNRVTVTGRADNDGPQTRPWRTHSRRSCLRQRRRA